MDGTGLKVSERVDHVRSIVEWYGTTYRMLDRSESRQVSSLAHCVSSLLDMRWGAVAIAGVSQQLPVLCTHMSDGWSVDAQNYRVHKLGNISFRRADRYRAEYLAHKSLIRTHDSQGQERVAMRLDLPFKMPGKTGAHVFSAAFKDPWLRFLCPSQIIINSFMHD